MENKKLKLYNLLTTILPFVFLMFALGSLALVAFSSFKFGLLSLNINTLKEVFSDPKFYLGGNVISIPEMIGFFAFTLVQVVLFIIMLVLTIILFCKTFSFLKKGKEYKERKEAFAKFGRKALTILSLSTIIFATATNAGSDLIKTKAIPIILVSVSFVGIATMDLLFDKFLGEKEQSWLDFGLNLGKRVVAFATTLIMVLSLSKAHELFETFFNSTNTNGEEKNILPMIFNLVAFAFFVAMSIIALKEFRKFTSNGAFSENKKNPYKRLFVTGIIIIAFIIIILVSVQFGSEGKFVSVGRLFEDLGKLLVVPLLAAVSGIVISCDKEKKAKTKEEVVDNK